MNSELDLFRSLRQAPLPAGFEAALASRLREAEVVALRPRSKPRLALLVAAIAIPVAAAAAEMGQVARGLLPSQALVLSTKGLAKGAVEHSGALVPAGTVRLPEVRQPEESPRVHVFAPAQTPPVAEERREKAARADVTRPMRIESVEASSPQLGHSAEVGLSDNLHRATESTTIQPSGLEARPALRANEGGERRQGQEARQQRERSQQRERKGQ